MPTMPLSLAGSPEDPAAASADSRDHTEVAVAYALGRRVGSAVERNRIRRRLRAAVSELDRRGEVLLPGGCYLLMSDAEAADCPFPDLVTWVEGAVRKAGDRSIAVPQRPRHTPAPPAVGVVGEP
jgi:ribonuclease P protein component